MGNQKVKEHANHLVDQMQQMMDKQSIQAPSLKKAVGEHGAQLLTAGVIAAIGLFPGSAFAGELGHGVHETMLFAFTDQKNLAGPFFQASIVPYLTFLYFLRQDVNGLSPVAKGGFTYLLTFVLGTIVTS